MITINTNKTVLITGASRGIGKAIALKYAKNGYNTIITSSKSFHDLIALQEEILSFNLGTCLPILADVSNYDSVKGMFEEVSIFHPKIDVVVNNAGISHWSLFTDTSYDTWHKIINTNLNSLYNVCFFCVPLMLSSKSGTIINISSIWGSHGAACEVAYSTSKGGVNAFTKSLAKELAPSNIRVNAISCGAIDTDMNSFLTPEEKKDFETQIPLGRFGKTEEVASLCFYLSSDEANYITGEIINISGGY